MITDATRAYYDKIRVIVRYKDEKNKKNVIGVICTINLTEEYLQIISNYIVFLMTREKYKTKFKDKDIPVITEENLYQIKELAKRLKVKRRLLENFYFDLNKITVKGFKRFSDYSKPRYEIAPSTLQLEIDSAHGVIVVLLETQKVFNPFTRKAPKLVELSKLIKQTKKSKSMAGFFEQLESSK